MDKGKGRAPPPGPPRPQGTNGSASNPSFGSFVQAGGKGRPSFTSRGLQDGPNLVDGTLNSQPRKFRTQREQVEADGFDEFLNGRGSSVLSSGERYNDSGVEAVDAITQWLDHPPEENFDHQERPTRYPSSAQVDLHHTSNDSLRNEEDLQQFHRTLSINPDDTMGYQSLLTSTLTSHDILEYLDQGTYTEDVWALTGPQKHSLRNVLGGKDVALQRLELLRAHFKAKI